MGDTGSDLFFLEGESETLELGLLCPGDPGSWQPPAALDLILSEEPSGQGPALSLAL